MVTEVRHEVFKIRFCMKKILSFLVFVFPFISIQARSQDSLPQNPQVEKQTLVQRVDSLEHELSYLKLTYELYTLNSDIKMFANEVDTKSIEIRLDLYNRNFNYKLGDSYKQYYESCQHHQQSIFRLIEARKKFFDLKVMTYPYSESELNTLMASYNVVNEAYDILDRSMKKLKIIIDAYNELM